MVYLLIELIWMFSKGGPTRKNRIRGQGKSLQNRNRKKWDSISIAPEQTDTTWELVLFSPRFHQFVACFHALWSKHKLWDRTMRTTLLRTKVRKRENTPELQLWWLVSALSTFLIQKPVLVKPGVHLKCPRSRYCSLSVSELHGGDPLGKTAGWVGNWAIRLVSQNKPLAGGGSPGPREFPIRWYW